MIMVAICGGIEGFSSGESTIENCFNIGDIVGFGYDGGIFGERNDSTKLIIKNCYNAGKVKGADVGGIGGVLSSPSEVENCYYLANCCEGFWYDGYGNGIYGNGSAAYFDASGEEDDQDYVTTGERTKEQMQGDSFIEELNSGNDVQVWKKDTNNINNGYPIL